MKTLMGKRVLITGAGHGIGRSQSLAFAREGAVILGTDMNAESLPQLADDIRAAGGEAHTFVLDVTDEEQIRDVRNEINNSVGPIDCLVNNAGVVSGGAFLDIPLEKHLLTYRVNTLALVAMTHIFLPDLLTREQAHIVHIASASGFVGLPFGTTYASSKWAVIGFSESLRQELQELGHRHVGVTAVCPGYIKTGMFDGVKSPRGMKMLTPELIAARVVSGVKRNKPLVIEPPMARLAPMMLGIVPTRMLDSIGKVFGLNTTMQQWRGHRKTSPAEAPKVGEKV